MKAIAEFPIPKRMSKLDRDPRGYPIPVMVFRDSTGRPHFTVNNEGARALLLHDDQCGICGQKLLRMRWFVGGPASALLPNGAYNDPPMHRECAHYALRVCPYLAVPSYAKRIDAKTVPDSERHATRIFTDPTMIPVHPPVFVCGETSGQTLRYIGGPIGPIHITPKRPFHRLEYWQDGREIRWPEAERLIKPYLADLGLAIST